MDTPLLKEKSLVDSPRGLPAGALTSASWGHKEPHLNFGSFRINTASESKVASLPLCLRLPLPFFGPGPVIPYVLQTLRYVYTVFTCNPAFLAVLGGEIGISITEPMRVLEADALCLPLECSHRCRFWGSLVLQSTSGSRLVVSL